MRRENVKKNIFCQEINTKNTPNNVDVENELNEVHVSEIENDADEISTCENENEINTCENENIAYEELHVTGEGEMTYSVKTQKQTKKKIFEIKPKICRKRLRHPQEWKRNKATMCRERGLQYVSQRGKVMLKKVIEKDLLCKEKCRLQCGSKFNLEAREAILKKFYKLENNAKNCLLFKSIDIHPVARHRIGTKQQKQNSFAYSISFEKQKMPVCKDAFCSLYQIGRKKIEIIQKQLKSGLSAPSPSQQGRHKNRPHKISEEVIACIVSHIKKFPAENSHYSRNKNENKQFLSPLLNVTQMHKMYIKECKEKKLDDMYLVKISMYRHIFETRFNLSFGHPKSDTCSVCDAGGNTADHKDNYTFAFESQKIDRQKPLSNKNIVYITMDLQQTMPLPKLSTSKAFYLRQMWLYNFGIHCITYLGQKSYFFTWTEDVANRGSNEIASCLFRFCKMLKKEYPETNHLIVWSDSCAGQNKNFVILGLYEYLILNCFFKIIDHKFPEVGHSYLDSDRDFGRIEKVIRKHQTIFIPDQYRDIIKSSSTKNSICVNMENFFYNFEELPGKLYLFRKQKNTLKDKINLRDDVKWIRVDEFGYYYYKTCLNDYTPFRQVDLNKKGTQNLDRSEIKPTRLTQKTGGLTLDKLQNLKDQIKFVEEEYRWFYEDILKNNTENPKKKRKTC